MKQKDFERLVTSVKQVGAIRRGHLTPGRATEFRPEDVRMNNLQDELIQAHRDGKFLDTVYELSIRLPEQEKKDLTNALVDLHNTSKIDVVTAFGALRNAPENPDFFLIRRVLEAALLELNANVLSVMKCVIRLTNEAGQDLASHTLIGPYTEFCSKIPSRSHEALRAIQEDPDSLMDLLSPTLVAGARHNVVLHVQKALEFSKHSDLEVRKRAIFALGRIQYQTKKILMNMAIKFIAETVALEDDDHLLGKAVKSAFDIYSQNPSNVAQVASVFSDALEKGAEITLNATSEVLGFHTDEIPAPLLNILLKHLVNVLPEHKGTLGNIDFGLEKLLTTENTQDAAIVFLEQLLTNSGIEVEVFDSAVQRLLQNENGLLNHLMTRWLLGGEQALCHAIEQIIKLSHDKKPILAVASKELTNADSIRLIFLARKVTGYLFFHPVTATSILLSLVPCAKDEETSSEITQLIFEPMLLNYPGEVGGYLEEQSNADDPSKATSQEAIQAYAKYIEDMSGVEKLSEHRPSVTHHEVFMRRYSRQMQQGRREDEKQSVMMQLVKKSVLLYGTKSINYIGEPYARNRRMEIPLQKHSFSMEIPRLHNIDPFSLDYILYAFRHEKIHA